jgi:prepilin-type N-terminal cleavage/methylation domain-containing protein
MTMRKRGFSIPEVLTVTVIIGMLLSAMVVIVPLLAKAPMQMQSQVDQVNTAALALYKIRRDFSEGDTSGLMACSTSPVVSCAPAAAGMPAVQALAVATAEDGSGAFQVDKVTGNPNWQGFYMYWLVPNATGTAYDLMRAYEKAPAGTLGIAANGSPTGVTAALVNPLMTAAMAISPLPVLTNYVASISMGDSVLTSTINFKLVVGTTSGADPTKTNFMSNTYARN